MRVQTAVSHRQRWFVGVATFLAATILLFVFPAAGLTRAPMCNGFAATQVGTPGADVLTGTAGIDVIAAGSGDDIVRGLAGQDMICGGAGRDRLDGGPADDGILGGPGADLIVTGPSLGPGGCTRFAKCAD